MKIVSRSEIKPGLAVLEEEASYGGVFNVARNCLGIKRPFIVLKIKRKLLSITVTLILDSTGTVHDFLMCEEYKLFVLE